jgi:hypothetical protein
MVGVIVGVCVLGRSELSNLKTGWFERRWSVEGEDVEGVIIL